MNRFKGSSHWTWSFLVVGMLAFALSGCEGDDGAPGPTGPQGPEGPTGPEGPPGPVPDSVQASIDAAAPESCAVCHDGAGDLHQASYDDYVDESAYVLTMDDVNSVDVGGTFDVTLTFSITYNGMPFDDGPGLPSLDQARFYAVTYDSSTGEYLNSTSMSTNNVVPSGNPGEYTLTQSGFTFAPEQQTVAPAGAHVYGYIADGPLFSHDSGGSSEFPPGTHVHLYDDVSNAAIAFGTAASADVANAYVSAANVEACEGCHGTPYLKHGYRAAVVENIPDFAACKSCHYDDRTGGHPDWQYMVDEPFNWATGVAATADYAYTANIMNDTHMSHAMEFPYPMSMSNCNSCHAGKLAVVLDNDEFTSETCLSCHPVQGIDAWPGQDYYQALRAPALDYLWQRDADLTFHTPDMVCTGCHGAGVSQPLSAYHNGYDSGIYDETGTRYSDIYSVSIDSVTMTGNLVTVEFSATDPAIVPEVLISMYGWNTKNFIVPSHARDGSGLCPNSRGTGCDFEYTPESSGGGANPLFTEDAASVPGAWIVTADLGAWVPTAAQPDDIPTMIADGTITKLEVSLTPEVAVDGEDVVIVGTDQTFDIVANAETDTYYKGAAATVDVDKCNVCHDTLTSTFHNDSGRIGEDIIVCKNCHNPTFPGSHLEMASRSIDNYVHAIHSFQPFDLDDVYADDDPVYNAWTAQHILHTFPNFTIRNCEACHVAGSFNVPDQAQSIPGVLSASYDIPPRAIGNIPEAVVGPASRACGGCHRPDLINFDLAGDLAALDAHTKAFGTYEENDSEDLVLFGIIDKIMGYFE